MDAELANALVLEFSLDKLSLNYCPNSAVIRPGEFKYSFRFETISYKEWALDFFSSEFLWAIVDGAESPISIPLAGSSPCSWTTFGVFWVTNEFLLTSTLGKLNPASGSFYFFFP